MGVPHAEIEALIGERIAALRDKDAARAVAMLADDLVAFELAPPLVQDGATARSAEALAAWLAGFEAIDVTVRDLEIEADGNLGFAHALHHLQGTRRGGAPVRLWLRSTLCFRRGAMGWEIVHAHSSVPFHMDGSFRAATDLEP